MSWKCLSQEYVLTNKFMKVRKDKVELPNGVIMDGKIVVSGSIAAIYKAIKIMEGKSSSLIV